MTQAKVSKRHNTIKIAYVVSTLQGSGPTRQLFNIISNLDRNTFQPTVLTLSPEPAETMRSQFEKSGIPVKSLGMGRLQGFFQARSAVKDWLLVERPAILHTQGLRSDALSASLGNMFKGLPVPMHRIATLRNYPFYDYPMTYGKKGWLMAIAHLRALRKLEQVVTVSQSVSEAVLKHQVKTLVIRNGTDTNQFRLCQQHERVQWRKKFSLPLDGRIWIATGHLSSRKDPELMIRAVLRTREDQLVLVGDGPLASELRDKYLDTGRIHFLGRQTQVENLLGMADGFMSASQAEGLPNAVMEALACGLPCVLSDIAPHVEMLDLAPKAGLLFALGDLDALYECLVKIDLDSKRESIRDAALEHFSAVNMSQQYAKLYVSGSFEFGVSAS